MVGASMLGHAHAPWAPICTMHHYAHPRANPHTHTHTQVICHGIPDMRELQEGDIVNIDVSTFYKGYHGDLNEVGVGDWKSGAGMCVCVSCRVVSWEMEGWLCMCVCVCDLVGAVSAGEGTQRTDGRVAWGRRPRGVGRLLTKARECAHAHTQTFLVGQVDEAGQTLVRCAFDCLAGALASITPGKTMYQDVGKVISKVCRHAMRWGEREGEDSCRPFTLFPPLSSPCAVWRRGRADRQSFDVRACFRAVRSLTHSPTHFRLFSSPPPYPRMRALLCCAMQVAAASGCSVVRTYCGHGIGELFHTNPTVPHYPKNKAKGTMKPGHVFTIEPMINLGDYHVSEWGGMGGWFGAPIVVLLLLWRCVTRTFAPGSPPNTTVRHVARRVDGRDPRRLPLGAVRAHDPHHGGRLRAPDGAVSECGCVGGWCGEGGQSRSSYPPHTHTPQGERAGDGVEAGAAAALTTLAGVGCGRGSD